jgi:hypothetical protein
VASEAAHSHWGVALRLQLAIVVIVIFQRIRGGFESALSTTVIHMPVEAPALAISVNRD